MAKSSTPVKPKLNISLITPPNNLYKITWYKIIVPNWVMHIMTPKNILNKLPNNFWTIASYEFKLYFLEAFDKIFKVQ